MAVFQMVWHFLLGFLPPLFLEETLENKWQGVFIGF